MIRNREILSSPLPTYKGPEETRLTEYRCAGVPVTLAAPARQGLVSKMITGLHGVGSPRIKGDLSSKA